MIFVSLIPFLLLYLFHCCLQSLVHLFVRPYMTADALLMSSLVSRTKQFLYWACKLPHADFYLMSSLVITLVTFCWQLVVSGLTVTREHIMSLCSGLPKYSGQQCCAKWCKNCSLFDNTVDTLMVSGGSEAICWYLNLPLRAGRYKFGG